MNLIKQNLPTKFIQWWIQQNLMMAKVHLVLVYIVT